MSLITSFIRPLLLETMEVDDGCGSSAMPALHRKPWGWGQVVPRVATPWSLEEPLVGQHQK